MKVRAERQTAARESAFFLLPGLALLCFGGAPLLGWLCVGYLLVWLGDLFRAPVFAGAAAAALHAAAVAVLWRRCYALHHAKRCVYIQSSLESSLALLSTHATTTQQGTQLGCALLANQPALPPGPGRFGPGVEGGECRYGHIGA